MELTARDLNELDQVNKNQNEVDKKDNEERILYKIHEKPPILLGLLLGMQQFITMYGGAVAYPHIVASMLCMKEDDSNKSYLMQTVLFTSGLSTLLQVMFGTKLPLIQGPSLSFLIPVLVMSSLPEHKCPDEKLIANMTQTEYDHLWKTKLVTIQGSIIVVGIVGFLFGLFGLVGKILHLISPLIIGPTIVQLGLSLAKISIKEASKNWTFSLLTIGLITLFTQYLNRLYIKIPKLFLHKTRKEDNFLKVFIFKLFPVLLTIILMWILAAICTYNEFLPTNDDARLDGAKLRLIDKAPYLHLPMPFQWGKPLISGQIIIGVACAFLVCVFESIGNYFACAQLSEAPSPPKYAINRGVALEGLCTIITGIFGSGSSVTSYSENIGAIKITLTASRSIILYASFIMIGLSFFGKISAYFSTIPAPIIGGILFVLCSIITAVGISIIQFVNLNNSRNLFIIGISLFFGFAFPEWFKLHNQDINTGSQSFDHLLIILITNPMFVTLLVAFILDNTVYCENKNDRGIQEWFKQEDKNKQDFNLEEHKVYALPEYFDKLRFLNRFMPIFSPKNQNISTLYV